VVTALKKEDGELTATDQEAVDELANCFQKIFTEEDSNGFHHGLRGSASPVLTATGFVNGRWQFSTPHRIHTP